MVELLKTSYPGVFCEDEGSTPVLQPRTQICLADPLVTGREVRRALDFLNPEKDTGPVGLFTNSLITLSSHIAPVLAPDV